MGAAIEVSRLAKRYGARAVVDGVSFSVAAGTVFSLLGRNGAGKTTTVECIEGFRRPDAGDIRVLGLDPWRHRDRVADRVGVMLQDGGAYQAASPREMLDLYARLYSTPRAVDELLDVLGLAEVADARFRTLSGGEKQRVNLALALVGSPTVIFLDEPTAGMDPGARRTTWELIEGLRAQGAAVLLTTHHIEEAQRLADVVGILHQGRLVASDSPDNLTRGAPLVTVTTDASFDTAALATAVGAPVRQVGRHQYEVEADADAAGAVTSWLAAAGVGLLAITSSARTLEDVFLELTAGEAA